MKICHAHWQQCRAAVSESGMDSLVANSGEEAMIRMAAAQRGEDFEPLMELNLYLVRQVTNNAGPEILIILDLEAGGALCPLCLIADNCATYDVAEHLKETTDLMAEYCRKKGFLKAH